MDYETKIYLVEFITNPAWWSVIATFVAAIVAACITHKLGKRQNELQEQQLKLQAEQTRQQDYEIYRRMYTRIDNIDVEALSYLHVVASALYHMVDKEGRLTSINEMLKKNETLNDEFTECTFDLELKQCGGVNDVGYYYKVLSEMKDIAMMIKYLIESDKVSIVECFAGYQINETTNSSTLIEIILSFCKDAQYKRGLASKLNKYAELIETSKQSPLKTIIKNRITADTK
ncbi:MAG: hypothetical protein IKW31_02170 [Alistipes sp.]|nr:hypothetical protein [Alistipes sp.]MBR5200539.1 hypothetical protein [Alistipes sp.]